MGLTTDDTVEEKISEFENQSIGTIQTKKQKEIKRRELQKKKKNSKASVIYEKNVKRYNIHIVGLTEREERLGQKKFLNK